MAASISIIIPAYNAANTIIETLESVLTQTSPNWEVIIVDDGSVDETMTIANRFIEKDGRIRALTQSNQGVSVARNTGISHANFEWLLFLDADDWISPYYIERAVNLIASDPDVDAVHCGWVRIAPDGSRLKEMYAPHFSDMFPVLAKTSPFAVHACIVKKSVAEMVGMFDASVKNCQDWDFWQRVARTGAKFGAIKEVLALYRMQPNSLSSDRIQFYTDALRMLMLGHSADPRVRNPHPDYLNGQPRKELPGLKLYLTSWFAGLLIGKEKDARLLLKFCEDDNEPNLDALTIAENIFETALVTNSLPLAAWYKLWPKIEKCIVEFLVELELQSKSVGLTKSTLIFLESMILQHTELRAIVQIGMTQGIQLEITEPIADIYPMQNIERLYLRIQMEGNYLGKIELPVCGKLVSGWLIKDAIAAKFAWQILGRFFEYTVYSEEKYRDTNEHSSELHDRIGWKVFLQQLWDKQIRNHWLDKELNKIVTIPSVGKGLRVIELSKRLPKMVITFKQFRAVITIGGVAVGIINVPFKKPLINSNTLRNAIGKIGIELCRVCVREGLMEKPLNEKTSLKNRLSRAVVASQKRNKNFNDSSLKPAAVFAEDTIMLAHRNDIIGTSSSRRAMLPAKAMDELIEMAKSGSEQIVATTIPEKQDNNILYVPELIKFPSDSVNTARSIIPNIIKRKIRPTTGNKANAVTRHLPILKYYHVSSEEMSNSGCGGVTPELFEQQLRYLHDNDYYSANWDDWINAIFKRSPLIGKAIIITFDEGYIDFYRYAWPLLKKYGFMATVFLSTSSVGQTINRDTIVNEKIEMMGWQEILELQKEGVQFGSHSATHRSLMALSPGDIVYEAAQSRRILQQKLAVPVKIFSYPFGHTDSVVSHLVGACGYTVGLTSKPALSTFFDDTMNLPCIEIREAHILQDVIDKINMN
jgi:glycosyltransferase involved in cell wall biosynthesis/peptidoglycan/xylan/chitin deacetylase (PgdA/CDA1 family)